MRVVSKARLKRFWEIPGREAAEGPFRAWYTHVANRTVLWRSWSDVKASFASASLVGDCVVFNVGVDKYRLVCRVRHASRKVFVLKVMTHVEYDRDEWKGECGCFESPPTPPRGRRP